LSAVFFSAVLLVGCGGVDPQKALVGQWDIVESTVARDLIADRIEFLGDGTGMMEASSAIGIGESFTWRVDTDGRLIITSPIGIVQIHSIVEISKSTLIMAGNIPSIGNIRTTYSRRGRAKPVQHAQKARTGSTFTDSRDRKRYRTVKVGDQTWMAENLNFNASGSACYANDPSNCDTYGRLYDWNTARAACPAGWRLPSDADWETLINFVGSNAGTKLKSRTGWHNNGNGTDDFGFSALPGGFGWDGSFGNVGYRGYWWSATEYDASNAWSRPMYWGSSDVYRWDFNKTYQFSVRCLQD
jgi:uncharacterized protein (TIGR02145 family)